MAKKGLGKGLDALIPVSPFGKKVAGETVILLSLEELYPNVNQPRRDFNPVKLQELAESIAVHGIIQPILVSPGKNNNFEIVAGERRWRAAKLAGLKEIPCIVKEYSNKLSTEMALIENIQRENLNVMEEAEAYLRLIEEHDFTQEMISQRLGKSRSYIGNTLRLMNLPLPIQGVIREGLLTAGHARAVLMLKDPEKRQALAEKLIKEKMSVRQAEDAAQEINKTKIISSSEKPKIIEIPAEIKDLENRLRSALATKVKISGGKKRGKIEIDYYGAEDLERIISTLFPESY